MRDWSESEATMTRKPIAALELWPNGPDNFSYFTVVCDDGSVWEYTGLKDAPWNELPPIPETERALQKHG